MPAPFFFKEEYPLKMKKTDIGVVGFMYAVCAFFYVYSYQLTAESKKYPMFTIILLFGLTTLYLVQMIIAARKFGVESGVNEVFEGFKPAQFFVSLALTIVYFLMMKYLGFFTATVILHVRVPALSESSGAGLRYIGRVSQPAHISGVCSVPRRSSAQGTAVLREG